MPNNDAFNDAMSGSVRDGGRLSLNESDHRIHDKSANTPDMRGFSRDLDEMRRLIHELNTAIADLKGLSPPPANVRFGPSGLDLDDGVLPTLADLEIAYINHVMQQANGNKTVAAQRLGIDPSTLYRKLARVDEGS